jgi:hypothetical protein
MFSLPMDVFLKNLARFGGNTAEQKPNLTQTGAWVFL